MRCQRRMSAELSSEPNASGAFASRSKLTMGQRSEGFTERVAASDFRQALRRSRRWICFRLMRSSVIGGGLLMGCAARPTRRACWRPRPNRCSPVCPRPGTSERAAVGLVARKIRAASGIMKKGGLCWRWASSSRNRNRLRRMARPRPSRSLTPFTERYAVSRLRAVYRPSSSRAHSSAIHSVRPRSWSR